MSGVDRVVALAREQEPAPLDAVDAEAWVRLALREADREEDRGAAPTPRPARRYALAGLAVAAVAAAFALGWLGRPAEPAPVTASEADRGLASRVAVRERPEPVEISRVALPTGDALHVAAGARYAVQDLDVERRLSVEAGLVLFDVAPAGAERPGFGVSTPQGEVEVLGTVFSVRVEGGRTVVRVYEGRVLVRFEGTFRVLGAREAIALGPDGWSLEPAPDRLDDAMAAEAFGATARRGADLHEAAAPEAQTAPPVVAAESLADPSGPRAPRSDGAPEASPEPEVGSEAASPRIFGGSIPRPAFARRWIADGQAGRARATAQRAIAEGYHAPTWRMVEGDALRALGRHEEAARSYELAARGYGGALAARAALRAAEIYVDELRDPPRAAAVLDRHASDPEPGVGARIEVLRHRIALARGAASPLGAPR